MRVDGLDHGDGIAMQVRSRSAGIEEGCGDGRTACRHADTSMVCGLGRRERDQEHQPRDRGVIGGHDGVWHKHGDCRILRRGPRGIDGMRGDGVGVGDVGQVYGRSQGEGIEEGRGDDGRAARELDAGMEHRRGRYAERDAGHQPERSGGCVDYCAWIGDGGIVGDSTDATRTDGMRGDRVGVGDGSDV